MNTTLSPQIQGFRLVSLKHALRLEIKGLRHSRGSVYALVKREFGFRGSKAKVLAQLEAHIETFNQEHGFTQGEKVGT
jgi:hypothetical protein